MRCRDRILNLGFFCLVLFFCLSLSVLILRDRFWEIKVNFLNFYIKRKCFYNNYCFFFRSDRSNFNRNLGGNWDKI